ncbi:hypothetical protein [Peribacillus sp. SCS-37]|uniref:hypothetical protein n=1 Tax=Paraperibacillus esterisolvens TaxID=3115296 RepID=UPI00390579B3
MTKRAVFIPLFLLLILVLLLFIENTRLETMQPSVDWSRSIETGGKASTLQAPFIHNERLFFAEDHGVSEIICSAGLDCKKKKVADISIPGSSAFWTDGKDVIYQDDTDLYLFRNGEKKLMEKGLSSARAGNDSLIFWKNEDLYIVDTVNKKSKKIHHADYPIIDAAFEKDSFVVAEEKGPGIFKLTLFEGKRTNYKKLPLPEIEFPNGEVLEAFKLSRKENDMILALNTMRISQGNKSFDIWEAAYNLKALKKPVLSRADFMDQKSGAEYKDPRNMNFRVDGGSEQLLFMANGQRYSKFQGYNLYLAEKKKGKWTAQKVSTTRNLPNSPVWTGKGMVMWVNFTGGQNDLYGASTNKDAIEKGSKITKTDVKFSASNTVTALFGSFLVLFSSMMWVILPCTFYAILFFSKGNLLDDDSRKWVLYVPILLFLLTQLYYFNTALRKDSYVFAPEYLTFHGSFYIWPCIAALISFGVLRLSRLKDVNAAGRFFYFAVVDILILMFLIGPYIL